ncbi:MAG: hypothetical protein NC548_32855 [Lachnospiraceae bacterium]|nr:hypothetical protein [Lachnospiraceae bacterium]
MGSIKEVIESAGLPAERGVYTGKCKPAAYCTFLRLNKSAAVSADDKESSGRELYRVTLFCKGNFEGRLELLTGKLAAAGYYINGVDAEHYETETGYWLVPVTIEILKE